jgi:hypothetical protein
MRATPARQIQLVAMVSLAVVGQLAMFWFFSLAAGMIARPDPYAQGLHPFATMLYGALLLNVAVACALYIFSKRILPNAWERVWWTAIAMAQTPWSMGLLLFFPLPLPWQFRALVGAVAPYAIAAALLHQLEQQTDCNFR